MILKIELSSTDKIFPSNWDSWIWNRNCELFCTPWIPQWNTAVCLWWSFGICFGSCTPVCRLEACLSWNICSSETFERCVSTSASSSTSGTDLRSKSRSSGVTCPAFFASFYYWSRILSSAPQSSFGMCLNENLWSLWRLSPALAEPSELGFGSWGLGLLCFHRCLLALGNNHWICFSSSWWFLSAFLRLPDLSCCKIRTPSDMEFFPF